MPTAGITDTGYRKGSNSLVNWEALTGVRPFKYFWKLMNSWERKDCRFFEGGIDRAISFGSTFADGILQEPNCHQFHDLFTRNKFDGELSSLINPCLHNQ